MRIIDLSNDSRFSQYGKPSRSGKRRSKYGNKKTVVDGITFDSKKEAVRYCELKRLERGKAISNLRLQVKYLLIPTQYGTNGKVIHRATSYYADFVYIDNRTGEEIVEDAKGHRTEVYKMKKKLMFEKYGIRIREV